MKFEPSKGVGARMGAGCLAHFASPFAMGGAFIENKAAAEYLAGILKSEGQLA
jgi:hypothetical protein